MPEQLNTNIVTLRRQDSVQVPALRARHRLFGDDVVRHSCRGLVRKSLCHRRLCGKHCAGNSQKVKSRFRGHLTSSRVVSPVRRAQLHSEQAAISIGLEVKFTVPPPTTSQLVFTLHLTKSEDYRHYYYFLLDRNTELPGCPKHQSEGNVFATCFQTSFPDCALGKVRWYGFLYKLAWHQKAPFGRAEEAAASFRLNRNWIKKIPSTSLRRGARDSLRSR